MEGSMGRSLGDHLKATFLVITKRFKGKSEPVNVRVANAKMTHNRMKALETPDYLKEKHAVAASVSAEPEATTEFQLYATEEEVSKQIKSRAAMSHYRLAALSAILPPEANSDLSTRQEPGPQAAPQVVPFGQPDEVDGSS